MSASDVFETTGLCGVEWKYIFNTMWKWHILFFTLQRFGLSPSPNFKCIINSCLDKSVYHRHVTVSSNYIYVTLKSSCDMTFSLIIFSFDIFSWLCNNTICLVPQKSHFPCLIQVNPKWAIHRKNLSNVVLTIFQFFFYYFT